MIPQLQPTSTMSDWETGARNAFRNVYSETRIYGCWFHYTQAIWKRIQKWGWYHRIKKIENCFLLRKVMA